MVVVSAVAEYIVSEILEIAGQAVIKRKKIFADHIRCSIARDSELRVVFEEFFEMSHVPKEE